MRRCSAAHTKYCLSDVICMQTQKRARSADTASSRLAVEREICHNPQLPQPITTTTAKTKQIQCAREAVQPAAD